MKDRRLKELRFEAGTYCLSRDQSFEKDVEYSVWKRKLNWLVVNLYSPKDKLGGWKVLNGDQLLILLRREFNRCRGNKLRMSVNPAES